MGLLPSEVEDFAKHLQNSSGNLLFEGVFTHMTSADVPGTETVQSQLASFRKALSVLRSHNLSPVHIHFGNSATVMLHGISECTLIRPGIALYGCKPDPAQDFPLDLKPVAALKGYIVRMKQVPAGTPVSYGAHYITEQTTWIATINAGYGQGVPRFLSNKGYVLIRGKKYRIAGNVTMDYIMVDAGPEPCIGIGDEAVIMGNQNGESITPDEIASMGNTIAYEILCNLSTAIDRYYYLNDSIVFHSSGSIF